MKIKNYRINEIREIGITELGKSFILLPRTLNNFNLDVWFIKIFIYFKNLYCNIFNKFVNLLIKFILKIQLK